MWLLYLKLLCVCAFFCLSHSVKAQKWSLDSCLHHAINNNPELQKLEMRVNQSDIKYEATAYSYYPSLDFQVLSGNHTGMFIDPTTNILDFGNNYVNIFHLRSEVLIFNNFHNRYYRQLYKNQVDINEWQYEKRRNELLLNIIQGYYHIAFLRHKVDLINQRKQTIEQKMTFIKASVDAGLIHRRDLLVFEYMSARDQADIMKAESRIQRQLFYMSQLLGLHQNSGFDIETLSFDIILNNTNAVQFETVLEAATEFYPHLKLGQSYIKYAENNLNLARTAFYPKLSLEGNVGTKTSTHNTLVDFGGQLSENNFQYVGLKLNVPIYNRQQTRTQLAVAQIDYDRAKLTALQLRLEIERMINDAVIRHNDAIELLNVYQKKYQSVYNEFSFASRNFDLGNIGVFELSEIASRFIDAEKELLNAQFELVVSHMMLSFYSGTFM